MRKRVPKPENLDTFNNRLQMAMYEKGYTYYRLGRETGYCGASIANWFRLDADPQFAAISDIAEYLGVSLDWLAYGIKERKESK